MDAEAKRLADKRVAESRAAGRARTRYLLRETITKEWPFWVGGFTILYLTHWFIPIVLPELWAKLTH